MYKSLVPKKYTDTYAKLFKEFRYQPITLLELGIQDGGSLRMWEEYFPYARIIGMDVQSRCETAQQGRIEVFIGDCTDHDVLAKRFARIQFDVVIDDASHDTYDIIKSYEYLRTKTKRFYCIEDLHAAKGVKNWLKDKKIKHEIHDRLAVIPC